MEGGYFQGIPRGLQLSIDSQSEKVEGLAHVGSGLVFYFEGEVEIVENSTEINSLREGPEQDEHGRTDDIIDHRV